MDNILEILGRRNQLFERDVRASDSILLEMIRESRFLVIGGAGSIGQAVVKEVFRREPKLLHVVDISENNLVELVRDLRSSLGYIQGEFRTFALDCGDTLFDVFLKNEGDYDYVLNLSALKHVRSEKDPYTLLRLIEVNILNTIKTLAYCQEVESKKYFAVSTDKAANPVNMMGASKSIMEMFLFQRDLNVPISTARFANVAFSDGSLLHGFGLRLEKNQPISAPNDIKRYFVTAKEAGELCLMSCMLGEDKDIYFPKLDADEDLVNFTEIATKFLKSRGYKPYLCESEQEARENVMALKKEKLWPCYFFESDTTGEKPFEEFYTQSEKIDFDKYEGIGVIKNNPTENEQLLKCFLEELQLIAGSKTPSKLAIVKLFNKMLPDFKHEELGKYLDSRM